jgi:hypothetical protein
VNLAHYWTKKTITHKIHPEKIPFQKLKVASRHMFIEHLQVVAAIAAAVKKQGCARLSTYPGWQEQILSLQHPSSKCTRKKGRHSNNEKSPTFPILPLMTNNCKNTGQSGVR